MIRSTSACLLLATSASLLSATAADAGELFLLGLVPQSYATDASDDGRVVAGYDTQSYWYWTRDTGVVQLTGSTVPPGNSVGGSANISGDGRYLSVSTLQGKPLKAEGTIYDIEWSEFTPHGNDGFHCDSERNSIWGMSSDKRYTCGLMEQAQCNAIAYVRDDVTGVRTNLGTLYFYKPSRANAVSDNGGTVCGWNDDYVGWRQGAVWVRNAQGTYVQTNLSAGAIKMSEAGVVSGNGQWVYGIGRSNYASAGVYRWSQATGVQPLGNSPVPGATGYPVAANADGTKVLCFFGPMGAAGSYLWTQENGYVPVSALAVQAGVTIPPGWQLNMVLGMSEDAQTIVGTAFGPNGTSPFVLDLRATAQPCPADLDGNGEVGAPDLALLLGAWDTFGGAADLNGDGAVGAPDLAVMLGAWGACP
ncbi:MAG: hypothetical protein RLY21_1239 [Planctomycetota bacterium]|jgi:uncharacterized membrane protein